MPKNFTFQSTRNICCRAAHKILRFRIPSHKILRYEISPTKFYVAKSRAVKFKSSYCYKISRAQFMLPQRYLPATKVILSRI